MPTSQRQRENWDVPLDAERCPLVTRGHLDICTATARLVAQRIYRRTGVALDREDLAQAAMEHVLRHSKAWDGKRRGYLWTAARWGAERHARRLLRAGTRARAPGQRIVGSTEGDWLLSLQRTRDLGPDDVAANEEALEQVRKAMARLPPREGQVLRMYVYDGLTGDEIGGRLRMSSARVHQIRHQAMRRLREVLLPKGLATAG